MPRLADLHPALVNTTEVLARELAQPTRAAPDWSKSEWVVARAAAAIHGVAPLLSGVLRWTAPETWLEHLREQRMHTRIRFERIQNLLHDIDDAARARRIAVIALKGAVLHMLGVYQPGERPMADVDLLVSDAEARRAAQLIEELGFRESGTTWKHREFVAADSRAAVFGEHRANSLKIDLHTRIQEALPKRRVDISSQVFPSDPQPGLGGYASRVGLMSHVLQHAAGAMVFHALRLIHLQDISRLAARMTEADWEALLSPACQEPYWWALPPLALAARYGHSIPEHVLSRFAAQCTWLLRTTSSRRRLSDVSLSRLWVPALPGLEWARTIREGIAYAAGRIVPSAEVSALRKLNAEQGPGAGPWGHLSQGQRILRWVTSRPARPEAVRAVHSAFGEFVSRHS